MRLFRLIPALLLVVFAMPAVNAQSPADSVMLRRIADDILRKNAAYENLRFLCKKVGPRLSGSAGAEKAVVETARMLREAGADTVYLQPCMVPHWVRGAKEEASLTLTNGKKYTLKAVASG